MDHSFSPIVYHRAWHLRGKPSEFTDNDFLNELVIYCPTQPKEHHPDTAGGEDSQQTHQMTLSK